MNPTTLDDLVLIQPERQAELDDLQRQQDAADLLSLGKRQAFADLTPHLYHSSRPSLALSVCRDGLEPRKPIAPDPTGVYLGLGFALLNAIGNALRADETDVFILEIDASKIDASNVFQRHDGRFDQFINAARNPRAVADQITAEQVANECFSIERILPSAFTSCVQISVVEVQEILNHIRLTCGASDAVFDDNLSTFYGVALKWIFQTRRQTLKP